MHLKNAGNEFSLKYLSFDLRVVRLRDSRGHDFHCFAANNLLKIVDPLCFIGGKSAWFIVPEINSR